MKRVLIIVQNSKNKFTRSEKVSENKSGDWKVWSSSSLVNLRENSSWESVFGVKEKFVHSWSKDMEDVICSLVHGKGDKWWVLVKRISLHEREWGINVRAVDVRVSMLKICISRPSHGIFKTCAPVQGYGRWICDRLLLWYSMYKLEGVLVKTKRSGLIGFIRGLSESVSMHEIGHTRDNWDMLLRR